VPLGAGHPLDVFHSLLEVVHSLLEEEADALTVTVTTFVEEEDDLEEG